VDCSFAGTGDDGERNRDQRGKCALVIVAQKVQRAR